jgi:hypothetical protein
MWRFLTRGARIFKERPASVKEASAHAAHTMLAECARNITCPWVQIWAEEEVLALRRPWNLFGSATVDLCSL